MVAYDGQVQGVFALADTLKSDAISAVAELKAMGVEVVMLTGDHRVTAEAIGKAVGVDKIYAEVLPDGKAEVVQALQAEGKKSHDGWRWDQRCCGPSHC
jgi:Cu+-exporting ATPase